MKEKKERQRTEENFQPQVFRHFRVKKTPSLSYASEGLEKVQFVQRQRETHSWIQRVCTHPFLVSTRGAETFLQAGPHPPAQVFPSLLAAVTPWPPYYVMPSPTKRDELLTYLHGGSGVRPFHF